MTMPSDDEIVLRQEAIGLNFHDIYVRSGQYRTMPWPGVPGIDGAGVVEWVGGRVTGVAVGDRVAYVSAGYGGYATRRTIRGDEVVPLPAGVDMRTAAAALLKGATADMLLTRVHCVSAGTTILVHAAAGGVGQILTRMAKLRGAYVIGTVGSAAKAEIARACGCDEVILRGAEDMVAKVHAATGDGVDVVYDGIGAATFATSLASLASFGQLVVYGQASGPVPPLAIADLAERSLSVGRPIVFHHIADPRRYRESAAKVLGLVASGALPIGIGQCFALRDAAAAHAALEQGATSGSTLLIP